VPIIQAKQSSRVLLVIVRAPSLKIKNVIDRISLNNRLASASRTFGPRLRRPALQQRLTHRDLSRHQNPFAFGDQDQRCSSGLRALSSARSWATPRCTAQLPQAS
jgi:hypothetical protein